MMAWFYLGLAVCLAVSLNFGSRWGGFSAPCWRRAGWAAAAAGPEYAGRGGVCRDSVPALGVVAAVGAVLKHHFVDGRVNDVRRMLR
jgi:hypothetical protein